MNFFVLVGSPASWWDRPSDSWQNYISDDGEIFLYTVFFFWLNVRKQKESRHALELEHFHNGR